MRMGTRVKAVLLIALSGFACSTHQDLESDDFRFNGPLGSKGATIEKIKKNTFRMTLGHAPDHDNWANMAQFEIEQHAKDNDLTLVVVFNQGNAYAFNDYFYSWSYDGESWHPIHWQQKEKDSAKGDTLIFPVFEQDRVIVGHQVPMSFEKILGIIKNVESNPHVNVTKVGSSLGARPLLRLTVTDPSGTLAASERWVHYISNQHPGEHNSQWRMVGMLRWLLSDQGARTRKNSIVHFVFMMSPDAPTHGWYRTNAQGVDMNRSYRAEGADKNEQAHEAFIWQKDLQSIMESDAPVTTLWGMHTWQGPVEPIILTGPEFGQELDSWEAFRDLVESNDTPDLIEPLRQRKEAGNPTTWTNGPHIQYGMTTILCEGAGSIYTKEENIESGRILMQSIAEFYK
ncbi:hypothetical protein GF406_07960 [candidate division KSB1 bacterium]|nr:hypothetical protein [candidate division KSB1 bacterium]